MPISDIGFTVTRNLRPCPDIGIAVTQHCNANIQSCIPRAFLEGNKNLIMVFNCKNNLNQVPVKCQHGYNLNSLQQAVSHGDMDTVTTGTSEAMPQLLLDW